MSIHALFGGDGRTKTRGKCAGSLARFKGYRIAALRAKPVAEAYMGSSGPGSGKVSSWCMEGLLMT